MPQQITQETDVGDIFYEWTVKEYEQYERNRAWYMFMLTVGLLLVLYGIFTQNFLFVLIIALAGIILFIQNKQAPPSVNVAITNVGVVLNNRIYPYTELKDFYLIYNPPETKMLYIDTKTILRPLLRIPLENMNPLDIRFSLREFLPEDLEKETEPFLDEMTRKWRIQ